MALAKQNLPIIFGKGIDTKLDEKVIQADKMLELENAVFTKNLTFSTRFGSRLLSKNIINSSDHIENSKKLITFKDELLIATDSNIYSYVESNDAWISRGSISAVAVSSKSISRDTVNKSVPDVNTLKNITVYAWEESGGVKATVIDDVTGLPVLANFNIVSTGVKPKVFSNKTYIFVYYINGNSLYVRRLNPSNPSTFEAAETVASNIENNYDMHPHGLNLVYIYNTIGGNCNVGYIQNNGLIGQTIFGFPNDVDTTNPGDSSVAIISKFDNSLDDAIYTFYANTTDGLTCTIYDLLLNEIGSYTIDSTTTKIRNITAILTDSSSVKVYYEIDNATLSNVFVKSNTITFAGTVGTDQVEIKSVGLVGKAFYGQNDKIYLIVAHESTYQPTYFVMKDTFSSEKLQVASVIAKYEAGGITNKDSSVSNVVNFKFPNLIKTQLVSADGDVYSLEGVQSTTLSYEDTKLFTFKELGNNCHIAGGLLYDYDGVSAVEHNFHFFPEGISNSIATTGGAISAGTRLYAFCYEWTDNQGQIHQSAPSIPLSVTNTGSTSVNTLTVPTLRVTKKCTEAGRANIRIVGYRTLNNGTVFYRFTSQTSTYFNDINQDTITIVDSVDDSAIDGNDILYTTGGVLENYSPGSCRLIEEYRNRLVAAGLEDAELVRYSRERVVNEAINFSEELSFRADSGKGAIEAIARLDEKLIIFKESEIFYQLGQGPTATGALDDYQQPIFITTDVGTTEPQSLVSMPLGIMFKSNKGYYLLSRALEPIYIGQKVEKYNSLLVTGAILCDQFNEVRFSTSDGMTLVYNYNVNEWSTFTNKESISAINWQNQWTVLKSDNSIYVEDVSTYFDGQNPIIKKITTAWFQAAQIQGAQRIYRILFIGKLKSQHRLQIDVSYDFDPSVRETFIYDTETILGSSYYGEGYYGEESYFGGADPVYQVEIRPSIQKCQAIRFTLKDLNDFGINGAGFELTAMTIQVGIKQGLFRPSIDKRVGPT